MIFSVASVAFLKAGIDYVSAKCQVTLTLGRTSKVIPPPWYKGGAWMEPLPGVFDMLQYFETI